MASYEDESSRVSDVDAPPHSFASYSSEYYHDLDEGEALRKAARAGILLLEKNQELQDENEALRVQLEILENERPGLKTALSARDDEVVALADERKKCLVEINSLRNELKAKSAMVTDLLDREQRFKVGIEEAEAAKRLAEYQLENLQLEFNELQRKESEKSGDSSGNDGLLLQYAVTNPAASYDSNQASVFTWADYEELMQKWQATSEENEALQMELKSVRKEVDNLRKKAAKATEYYLQVEKLEKKNMKLQNTNDALNEELTEERALLESLRTMNLMYKQIADSRPFSIDMESSSTALQPTDPEAQRLGISVQDVLLDTNLKLETELRELRNTLQLYQQYQNLVPGSNSSSRSNQISSSKSLARDSEEVAVELKRRLSRVSSNNSEDLLASDTASFSDFGGDSLDAMNDGLVRKMQEMQEKLSVAKDMLKHTKLQWSAAVASQKALEECNRSAQEEITRLTQQLDYQMSSMAARGIDAESLLSADDATKRRQQPNDRNKVSGYDSDDEDKWVEETAPFPAPPGDLNSPLIKCLLDHWTTDKSKIMTLTDWLHHAIRGTGKPTPLRLHSLTSEVAAGFAQLLVPIMREKHGVSVSIYRRDSVHVLSDLVLQTNQPSNAVQSYTTTDTASAPTSTSSASSSAPNDADSGRDGSKPTRPDQSTQSRFLKGETQFLYG